MGESVTGQYPPKTALRTPENTGLTTRETGTTEAKTTLYNHDHETHRHLRPGSAASSKTTPASCPTWSGGRRRTTVGSSGTRTSSPARRWTAPAWSGCWPTCGRARSNASSCGGWTGWAGRPGGLCQLFDELGERKVDLVSLKDGFSPCLPRRSAPCPHPRLGRRVRDRGQGRAGRRRSSRGTPQGQEVGRLQAGMAVEGQRRAGDRHPGDEGGGKKVAHIARVTGLSRPTVYRVLRQCVCASG